MSKRRRNRPNGPKPAQLEASSTVVSTPRISARTPSPSIAKEFEAPSPLAFSGEMSLPLAALPEPSLAIPCDATKKSVMIEPMASLDAWMNEPEAPPAEAAPEGTSSGEHRDMDSFPPLVSCDHEESRDEEPPCVLARRKRARKVVGVLVAAAALFFAFGVGKTALVSRGTSASGTTQPSQAQVGRVQPMIGGAMTFLARSVPVLAKQEPVAKPAEAVPAAAAPAAVTTDPAEGAKLRKEAESLLNRGRYKDSIEVSRAAIAADPSQAMPYLMLGTALQSTGKWKDGIEAYSNCVRHATRGPVHECSAVGGRK